MLSYTVYYVRVLKTIFRDLCIPTQNLYKEAWDKVKATGYKLSSDSVSLSRAKELKHNASIVSEHHVLSFSIFAAH